MFESRLGSESNQGFEHIDHMVDAGAQGRAVANEIVGAFRAGIEGRTRNGEDFPALFEGEPGRDQRSRAPRRFHDHNTVGEAGNDPVPPWEVPAARLPAHRHFGDDRAAILHDGQQQRLVLGRIDAIMPAGQHRDGSGPQRRLVGARVDAPGEARHHHVPGFSQLSRQALGEGQAGRGRVARSDHGDSGPRQIAAEPRTPMRGGAVSAACRALGKSGSPMPMNWTPRRDARANSLSASALVVTFRDLPVRRARSGKASRAADAPPTG